MSRSPTPASAPDDVAPHPEARGWPGSPLGWVATAYVAVAAIATIQRGVVRTTHTTFRIFRQSFVHLLAGKNLYVYYPAEQGHGPYDLFKYSPTAALLFAPFAAMPFAAALFAWDLLNALALLYALLRVIPDRRTATIAAALVLPQLFAAIQGSSSNALVTALMLLAFASLRDGHEWRGAAAIAVGATIKIFPLAALSFVVFGRRRSWWRLAVAFGLVTAILVALPLLVMSRHTLVLEYRAWLGILTSDAHDLAFGDSLPAAIRRLIGGTWPNWIVQLAGTILVILPLIVRRAAHVSPWFQREYLASLLVYVVLFNHQAEMESFVIAAVGAVIWYVGARPTLVRTLLLALVLAGGKTFPAAAVWLLMQWELWRTDTRRADHDLMAVADGLSSWMSQLASRSRTARAVSARSSTSRSAR